MDAVRISPETSIIEWYEDSYNFPDHVLTLRGRIEGRESEDKKADKEARPWLVLRAEFFHRGAMGWSLTLRECGKRHELSLGEVLHLLPDSLHSLVIEAHFDLIHQIREEVDRWVFRAERVAMNDRKQIDACGGWLHDAARLRSEAMDVRSEAGKPRPSPESNMMVNGKLRGAMEKGIRSTKPREN